jgi:hypothetical protein
MDRLSTESTNSSVSSGQRRPATLTSTEVIKVEDNLEALPGADLVQRGIEDLDGGRESAEALLVSIGAPRLRSLGVHMPAPIEGPEHKLYLLLAREKGDAAHSAYNALIRRLVSFEQAAACIRSRRTSALQGRARPRP